MEKNKTDMSDLPLKQYSLLASTSSISDPRAELVGASANNSTFSVERGSLDQCKATYSQLQPSCAEVRAIDLTGSLDLEAEKCKSPIFDKVEAISSNDAKHTRQGQWSHLYQLVNGSKNKGFRGDPLSRRKDKHVVGDSEYPKQGEAGGWNLMHWKTKLVHETRAPVDIANGKNPHSESALLPQDARMKILSTSSFSQYFGNQNLKRKGISIGHPAHKSEFDDGSNVQSDTKLQPSVVGANSGMDATLVQHGNGGIPLDSNTDGFSLREWLKPGQRAKTKFESINLFRQIVELVNVAHSEGAVLQHLRPSYFVLLASKKLKYSGSSTKIVSDVPSFQSRSNRNFLEEDIQAFSTSAAKYQKLTTNTNSGLRSSLSTLKNTATVAALQDNNYDIRGSDKIKLNATDRENHKAVIMEKSLLDNLQLEEKWYSCPEKLEGNPCRFSSNIYSLGVLLFELLCPFDSLEAHSTAMLDLQNRILPPFFLCGSPKEAGFCLWLIHPEPASRPNIREVLLSDLFHGIEELHSNDEMTTIANGDDMVESELLLDFLVSLRGQKEDNVVKVIDDIRSIEVDLKGLEEKCLPASSPGAFKQDCNLQSVINPAARNSKTETRFSNYMCQLEKAYFSVRTKAAGTTGSGRADRDLLKNREMLCQAQEKSLSVSMNQKPPSELDLFYSGLCKFTCYSKFELRGTLRNSDLLNSTNVICSLSFDRDEEYLAVAGVSKKIKIFEFSALVNDAIDIHYPVIEMGNKAKLSCISWNGYIKNYLASTDYDGIVQVWDASTAVALSQHVEHQRRA